MPPTLSAALAALPIALLMALMLLARWSAARAGLAAFAATLLVALTAFGYGDAIHGDLGPARALAGALAEAAFGALPILWILLPALAIYHLQQRSGAFAVLQRALARVTSEPAILALLVAWFFALFLEGAAGFGTPIALAAPFLVSAGFAPAQAVGLALVGHAAGVAFGAVGTPIVPQMSATGLPGPELARATGVYVGALGWLLPLAMVLIIARGPRDDGTRPRPRPRPMWGWAALAGLLFALPCFAIARWVGPELPTLGGALAGGALFTALWLRVGPRAEARDSREPPNPPGATLRAAAPYLLVVALVLVTRLVPPVQQALTSVELGWTLSGRFEGRIRPLYHPGTLLLVSLALGATLQRLHPALLAQALGRAARQLAPVAVALLAVLALSRLMVHAGMIDLLARAAVDLAGPAWPVLAPFVGVLGSFVTGSATASNILFSDFQQAAALQADLPVAGLQAAQVFGAGSGNMIAPLNLLAGAATVGLVGHEDAILRRTLGVCLTYALLGGLLTWLLTAA